MAHYIDLHCHILPALDDGPPSLAAAADLVEALVAIGFEEFYPTPHQMAGTFRPSAADAVQATARLAQALRQRGDSATLLHPPAGENMWDEHFLAHAAEDRHPCYPGNKAFLLEIPPAVIPPLFGEHLFHFRINGKLPVLAHVERYEAIVADNKALARIATTAALLVNLSSLGGRGGWRIRRAARRLVAEGWAHAVASDAHGLHDVAACKKGLAWIASALGPATLKKLLTDSPRLILSGELP